MATMRVAQSPDKKGRKIRKTAEDIIISIVVYFICAVVFLATVYPFWYCIVISFNVGTDAQLGGVFFWPRQPTLENYRAVGRIRGLPKAFMNTILRTVIGTISTVLFTGLIAFALSHKNLVGRNFYYTVLIIAMYVHGGMVAQFLNMKFLRLYNSFLVYIIPSMFGIWNCILMMNFFRSIPESLEESAKIDGANDITIFFRIIMPVATPILATIALYSGVGHWNNWYDTEFYTKPGVWPTAASELKKLISKADLSGIAPEDTHSLQNVNNNFTVETIRTATMVVTVFPITLIYPFLQKYFVKGIMIGSVKG